MFIKLTRLPMEKLKDDYSNLVDIPLPGLRQLLDSEQRESILAQLIQQTLAAGVAGIGVAFEDIPIPLPQLEVNCVGMAFLNGIDAVSGRGAYTTNNDYRERTRNANLLSILAMQITEGLGNGAYDPDNIASTLSSFGGIIALEKKVREYNPIKITRELFRENRFMVQIYPITLELKGEIYTVSHATAVIPLSSPTAERFAVELDSLVKGNSLPEKQIVGVNQFVSNCITINNCVDYSFEVYEFKRTM